VRIVILRPAQALVGFTAQAPNGTLRACDVPGLKGRDDVDDEASAFGLDGLHEPEIAAARVSSRVSTTIIAASDGRGD
jgi:hypothetical protein